MDRSADGHPACERIRGHGGSVSDPSGVARMTPPGEVIVAPLVRDRRQVLTDLVALTKPRVVLMVLVTTLVGYYVGLTGAPDWVRLLHLAATGRLYRDDYARAGVRLLPVIDPHGTSTERQIVTGCLALLGVSLLPTLTGLAGGVYFAGALTLGLAFVALGARQALAPSVSGARRVLLASLLYLPALLTLLALDKA